MAGVHGGLNRKERKKEGKEREKERKEKEKEREEFVVQLRKCS